MITDLQMYLTPVAGQLFNETDGNSEYGSVPYDLGAAGVDPAVGEALDVLCRVVDADNNVGTSYDVAVVASTTGAAGGTEAVVATSTILVANLTRYKTHRIGRIQPGAIAKRYLAAKVTTHGGTPTAGKLAIWLAKGSDAVPADSAGQFVP